MARAPAQTASASTAVAWRRNAQFGEHFIVAFAEGFLIRKIADNRVSDFGFIPRGETEIRPVSALGRYLFSDPHLNFMAAMMIGDSLPGRAA